MNLYSKFVKGKGTAGYINNRKVLTILRTVVLYALAIGIYLIGYLTLHTNKSLWSIFAVLGILPASKSAVNMIMFLRFKSLNVKEHRDFEEARGEMPVSYENILTTKDKTYYLPVVAYRNHTVCGYMDQEKLDASVIENRIKESLKLEKIDTTVKVFKNKKQFLERIRALNVLVPDEDDAELRDIVYATIQVISL